MKGWHCGRSIDHNHENSSALSSSVFSVYQLLVLLTIFFLPSGKKKKKRERKRERKRKERKKKHCECWLSALLPQCECRSPSTTQNPATRNCMLRGGEQKPPLLHFSQNYSQRNSNILPSLWDLEKVSKPITINNCCHIARRQTFVGNCHMMFYIFDVPLSLFMSDQYLHSPGFSCFCCR